MADIRTLKTRPPGPAFEALTDGYIPRRRRPYLDPPPKRQSEIQHTKTRDPENEDPVIEHPKNEDAEVKHAKIRDPENEDPKFRHPEKRDPKRQHTETQHTENRTGTFFPLSYGTLNVAKELDGNQFKVLLWFTIKAWGWQPSTQKPGTGQVRAAYDYIAEGAGVARSSAFTVVKKLIEKGLIRTSGAAFKDGNIYEVSPVMFTRPGGAEKGKESESRDPELKHAETKHAEKQDPEIRSTSSPESSTPAVRISDPSIRSLEARSLSQTSELPPLWELRSNAKTRERMKRLYRELKAKHGNEWGDELDAFPDLCDKNKDRFGNDIGNWLGLAETDFLAVAKHFRQKNQKAPLAPEELDAAWKRQLAESASHVTRARTAFADAFPEDEEKQRILKAWADRRDIDLSTTRGRDTAILCWFEEDRKLATPT
jgi:hypothetical protein